MQNNLRLEWLDPGTLAPNPRNYRQHPEKQKKILDAILSEVGWAGVALYNETTGRLIDGHARQEWAIQHGCAMPVLIGAWTEAEEVKILATLDPISAMAEQVDATYRELLLEIETESEDLRGWADSLLHELGRKQGLTDPDDVPELPAEPVTRPMDLWVLGEHRLLCGDCTNAEDVQKLIMEDKPVLMVTDPPYGVEYSPEWRKRFGARATGKVRNDDKCDWSEAWSLFHGDIGYVWHAGRYASLVQQSLEAVGFEIRSQIIWAKHRLVISRGHYHWQHETCWYAVRKGSNGNWCGDRSQTTLWQIAHNKSETGHGTQKPVECMRRPMENNTRSGQHVYDPFVGSGTSIIAAEEIGRKCLAIEIEPAYCDVSIRRWESFSGKEAVLDATSKTFREVADARR